MRERTGLLARGVEFDGEDAGPFRPFPETVQGKPFESQGKPESELTQSARRKSAPFPAGPESARALRSQNTFRASRGRLHDNSGRRRGKGAQCARALDTRG